MSKNKKPIIVSGTGYSINSEDEDEALFAEKVRLDAEFDEEMEPYREACIASSRQAKQEMEEAQWASLSPLGKVVKRVFG